MTEEEKRKLVEDVLADGEKELTPDEIAEFNEDHKRMCAETLVVPDEELITSVQAFDEGIYTGIDKKAAWQSFAGESRNPDKKTFKNLIKGTRGPFRIAPEIMAHILCCARTTQADPGPAKTILTATLVEMD